VADAVAVEPISASHFPAYREIYREFYRTLALCSLYAGRTASILRYLRQNSLFNKNREFSEQNRDRTVSEQGSIPTIREFACSGQI
jgi:hypothetical protein